MFVNNGGVAGRAWGSCVTGHSLNNPPAAPSSVSAGGGDGRGLLWGKEKGEGQASTASPQEWLVAPAWPCLGARHHHHHNHPLDQPDTMPPPPRPPPPTTSLTTTLVHHLFSPSHPQFTLILPLSVHSLPNTHLPSSCLHLHVHSHTPGYPEYLLGSRWGTWIHRDEFSFKSSVPG